MPEADSKFSQSFSPEHVQTLLGPSMVVKGELSGKEDLVVQGQFEGTINLQDHCLTVGPSGQVKAEIQAGRTVILGSVSGNISARDRIEIRKSGQVVGDLVSPGISIEDGAYFKGKIEILRKEALPSAISPKGADSAKSPVGPARARSGHEPGQADPAAVR